MQMRIRRRVKIVLLRTGLYYPLNLLRDIPDVLRWLSSGCAGFAPHPIKMMVVGAYLRRFSLGEFVESGTLDGETLGYISRRGVRCTSIELSRELYEAALVRFDNDSNVRLVQGDSAQQIPLILNELKTAALFWLDGHDSGGVTACAEKSTPISGELQAILSHPVKGHVILIDDARLFNGSHDYPTLDDLLRVIRDDGNYSAEVSIDIIRLVPRALPSGL